MDHAQTANRIILILVEIAVAQSRGQAHPKVEASSASAEMIVSVGVMIAACAIVAQTGVDVDEAQHEVYRRVASGVRDALEA